MQIRQIIAMFFKSLEKGTVGSKECLFPVSRYYVRPLIVMSIRCLILSLSTLLYTGDIWWYHSWKSPHNR